MNCPTCDAVTRVTRRAAEPGATPMTMIGCTDTWHPLAEPKRHRVSVFSIGMVNFPSRKIEGSRYRVHQSGALEIFGPTNDPVLLLAHGVWTDVAVSDPC